MSDEALRALEKKWRDESKLRQESADKMENDDPQYAAWHFGISDGLDKCADELAAILSARQEVGAVAWGVMYPPNHPQAGQIWTTFVGRSEAVEGKDACWNAGDDLIVPLYASPAHTSEARDAVLQGVRELAIKAAAHWDADEDMKVGKILMALAGQLPKYDKRADAFDAACDAAMRQEAGSRE